MPATSGLGLLIMAGKGLALTILRGVCYKKDMTRKAPIKKTALLLVLVYLFLSGFVMIGAAEHAAEHGHGAKHTTQHASFICTWMCAASSFVHQADQNLSQSSNPPYESLTGYIERFASNSSIFSFHIRSPSHRPLITTVIE